VPRPYNLLMFHSLQDEYLKAREVELFYTLDHPLRSVRQRYSFRYCELPPMGTGPQGNLIINCDEYLDRDLTKEVYEEFLRQIHLAEHRFHHMIPFGIVPSALNQQKCLDSFLINQAKYESVRELIKQTEHLGDYHQVKNQVAKQLGLNLPWRDVIHFKKLKTFFEKNEAAQWNDIAQYFPKLRKLVDSLPFKTIGYVMILRNNKGSKLDIHRDIFPRNHACHHINIALDGKPRPFFIYDSFTGKRHYKEPSCISYFFNEFDLHGADACDWASIILRIDGIFKDSFANKIGMSDGVTFDWSFKKPQNFVKERGPIKIWEETDI
jgi:hypothetical protein